MNPCPIPKGEFDGLWDQYGVHDVYKKCYMLHKNTLGQMHQAAQAFATWFTITRCIGIDNLDGRTGDHERKLKEWCTRWVLDWQHMLAQFHDTYAAYIKYDPPEATAEMLPEAGKKKGGRKRKATKDDASDVGPISELAERTMTDIQAARWALFNQDNAFVQPADAPDPMARAILARLRASGGEFSREVLRKVFNDSAAAIEGKMTDRNEDIEQDAMLILSSFHEELPKIAQEAQAA